MKKKLTQYDRILKHLLTGKSLTQVQATKRFYCIRLGAIIHKMREEYYIKTDRVQNISKSGKYAGKYTLVRKYTFV